MLNRRDFMKLGLGACLLPTVGCSRAEAVVSEEMFVFGTLVAVDVLSRDTEAARAAIADVSHAFTGKLDVLKRLVEAGADLAKETTGGYTALDSASTLPVLKYLRGVVEMVA